MLETADSSSRLNKLTKLLARLPDLLMSLGIGTLLIDEFLESVFSFSPLNTYGIRVSLGIALIALFGITINIRIKNLQEVFQRLDKKYLGVLEVLAPYEAIDFREMVYNSSTVKLLTLSGTKAGFLGDSSVTDALLDSKRKSSIVILLANPFAKAIIERYEKDEPRTYETGLDGIERRLLNLWNIINGLPKQARNKLDIRVFDNYPTISIIQSDKDLYATLYGYKLRGGDCPKVHSELDGEYSKFLLRHFNNIYEKSTPIADWVAKYHPKLLEKN